MVSAVAAHADFDGTWPFAADYACDRWRHGELLFARRSVGDDRSLGELFSADQRARIERLLVLGGHVTEACAANFGRLREVASDQALPAAVQQLWTAAGVQVYGLRSEGHWAQSVAEFACGLTLSALRRIPQLHRAMIASHEPWQYAPATTGERAGRRGWQFGDEPAFTNGTLCGKRVRLAGLGNIGARYASFAHALGADVAAWDAHQPEPVFHRAPARRIWRLSELVTDAQIFAPLLPLRDETAGLITAELIDALPAGCLVVLVTRAAVCDMPALRRRVLRNELALAADVFDQEPVPLDDPLLGRDNVVHTPHNAGRTQQANEALIDALLDQFERR